ncbi:hypothetical protein BDV32DRAFT_133138 [Aspergillus pseudonomiae]|uniref:Uncharacterized protein n=1 Tax=Aspergillus pseudonomiae TaxID=1506151 RepID=A0A5N7CT10_9EURO|nr:uncharacterized protein BDV37DRAFT_266058 [Aspergillus pseudonomiae]KAB8253965.1 hypothetical protein BDV32DRAFT_133138 [Aspergillus pseudonomiae]KAE8397284.1 hypothetical protein BDV37DRAFT_266058 [Aspergillus pseudonomiae]
MPGRVPEYYSTWFTCICSLIVGMVIVRLCDRAGFCQLGDWRCGFWRTSAKIHA